MLHKLIALLSLPFVLIGSLLHPIEAPNPQIKSLEAQIKTLQDEIRKRGADPLFGVYNPSGGNTYRLQSSIGATDTSFTLSSFKEPISGIAYTMAYLDSDIEYGTFEPGNTNKKEFVSFTTITQNSDGTATLGGVIRGLGFSTPFTASTTIAQTHSGQSIFILSNPPQQLKEYPARRNNEIIPGYWNFSFRPYATSSSATSSSQFATLGEVTGIAASVAATATEAIMGISVLSTNTQIAGGTASTTDGKPYILPTRVATSTPRMASTGWIPVTDSNGTLHPGFIATSSSYLWSASTTFSGLHTITSATTTFYSATTTFATTTASAGNMYPIVAIGTSTPSSILVRGGLIVGTSTYIAGGLGVGVATTSKNNIAVQGDVAIAGNLTVTGTATGVLQGIYSAISTCNTSVDTYAIWSATSSSATVLNVPIPVAGTIKNLYAKVNASNGGAQGEVVDVLINGVVSSSTPFCKFTNGNGVKTCSDLSSSVSVVAGDYINFLFDTGDTSSQTSSFSATVQYQ